MNGLRLPLLLVVLVIVAGLRFWRPPTEPAADLIAEPLISHAAPLQAPQPDLPSAMRMVTVDDEPVRNAFAIRMPPQPMQPVAVTAPPPETLPVAPATNRAAPPQIAIEPPFPLRIIGTWSDSQGPSVFFAGPQSTLQGKVGDVLLADYRVTAITPQNVVLHQISAQREVSLPVPIVPPFR